VRNSFAHSTAEVHLSDPPHRERLQASIALAQRNLLWSPMQLILRKYIAEEGDASQAKNDPELEGFVLLITILVAFLETGSRTVSPLQPSLTMTLETGITQRAQGGSRRDDAAAHEKGSDRLAQR
jgi:hypothetical protein